MKFFLKLVATILTVIMVIYDLVGFLALPALFVVIGLLNAFPWQYYVATIGGYIALLLVAEIAAHLIFKVLDKKYTSLITRKLEKYFDRFSKHE